MSWNLSKLWEGMLNHFSEMLFQSIVIMFPDFPNALQSLVFRLVSTPDCMYVDGQNDTNPLIPQLWKKQFDHSVKPFLLTTHLTKVFKLGMNTIESKRKRLIY